MKCPKCDYLGFETGDRCRNCGYDFSLEVPAPAGVSSGRRAAEGPARGPAPTAGERRSDSEQGHGDVENRGDASGDDQWSEGASALEEPSPAAPARLDVQPRVGSAQVRRPPRRPLERPRSEPFRTSARETSGAEAWEPELSGADVSDDSAGLTLDLDKLIGEAEAQEPPAHPAASPPAQVDRSLFPDDLDLQPPRPRATRAPLSVRRSTPSVPRSRFTTPPPAADLLEAALAPEALGPEVLGPTGEAERDLFDASPWRRVLAVSADLVILVGIDLVILYLTLRLTQLGPGEIGRLPLAPMSSFFALFNGGYFTMFAALGGQSIGQMWLGVRVVEDGGESLSLGRAVLRTLAWAGSVLPLGFGLWFALSADRRTLHDRMTQTRVVPSS